MHYGSFDPKFFGLSLYFTADQYTQWLDYHRVGPETTIPLMQKLIRDDPEIALDAMLSMTSSVHETKHFIDYLLCPTTNRLLYLRLLVSLNSMQFLLDARQAILPVPFTKWVKMSEEDRKAKAKNIEQNLPGFKLIDPLDFEGEKRTALELILDSYQKISEIRNEKTAGINLMHLFEAGAVCTQLFSITRNFGDTALEFFFKQLPPLYTKALNYMRLSMSKGKPMPWNIIALNSFVAWCLHAKIREDSVSSRLNFLLEYIAKNPDLNNLSVPREIYKKLDLNYGVQSTYDGLLWYRSSMENLLRSLSKNLNPSYFETRNTFQQLLRDWLILSKEMLNCFLKEKDRLLIPASFTDIVNVYRLEPSIFVHLTDKVIAEETLPKSARPWKWTTTDGRRWVSSFYYSNPNFVLNHKPWWSFFESRKDYVDSLSTSFFVAGDFLCSEDNRSDPDVQDFRKPFKEKSGLVFYELV